MTEDFDNHRRIIEGGVDIFCTRNSKMYTAASLDEPLALIELVMISISSGLPQKETLIGIVLLEADC